eukprot:scaffold18306_cov62-Cyclotella_meneghiniana.AAC.3
MKCPSITIAAAAVCILTHHTNAFTCGPTSSTSLTTNHQVFLHATRTHNKLSHKSSPNDTHEKTMPPHDRTIDRRKSPALWRYDLEYSITTNHDETTTTNVVSSQSNTNTNNNNNNVNHYPKAPPELMSPAGGWPQLKAAVANGADAIYLGLTSYSARARAANFDPDPSYLWNQDGDDDNGDDDKPASLARAVQYCHRYNVRVYVAFNTLVFDEELHEVQQLIEQIWECGVDAVIIQDVGVAKIVKEVVDQLVLKHQLRDNNGNDCDGGSMLGKGLHGAPMEIHASTQQTVTCADGVSFAAERTNATRVVLGRELSLSEIEQISKNADTEIEAFVHGALCVSYSGQCFSSEAWGGRSANR